MESNDELKEVDIKNRLCYYFDHIMRAWDIDVDTDYKSDYNYIKKKTKTF